ncbi:hypothetical protein GCM10010116_62060 [Microbispora rosea subsp. aerata]|nr:hypothetical protein GCM10010116_62060 [Microbispora rosea subsp. aerata]GIH59183.1 hypothetical protein Mro02_60970 [Microbispora rosea subsp. aerata]GLJ87325.1 hypothetical protein GCM10017588_60700 [Microbispora rosea subsp. aerata]
MVYAQHRDIAEALEVKCDQVRMYLLGEWASCGRVVIAVRTIEERQDSWINT